MANSFLNNASLPFGLRNNNPGNVRAFEQWQGMIGVNNGFCVFADVAWGVRAFLTDIRTDMRQGQNTIRKLITEYAPPAENNTAAYINYVVQRTGIGADTILQENTDTFKRLARAIIEMEVGKNYAHLVTDADILEGISRMSGGVPVAAVGFGISGIVLIFAGWLFYREVLK